jgi:hypothetical protein
MTAAWEELKAKTSAELTPALIALVPKLLALVPAIDPAIKVFSTLVDTLGMVVDYLIDTGLIKKKPRTEKDVERELSEFDQVIDSKGGWMNASKEDRDKRHALEKERDEIHSRNWRSSADMTKLDGEDTFVENMMAHRKRNGWGVGKVKDDVDQAKLFHKMYAEMLADPVGAGRDAAFNPFLQDEQRQDIQNQLDAITAGRLLNRGADTVSNVEGTGAKGEVPLATQEAIDQMNAMALAARQAAIELQMMKAPDRSIAGSGELHAIL